MFHEIERETLRESYILVLIKKTFNSLQVMIETSSKDLWPGKKLYLTDVNFLTWIMFSYMLCG